MGFTLRFMIGFLLILAACSSLNGASTWRHMKLLSQEPSTLDPAAQTREVNASNSHEEIDQKLKTDEHNKIISEFGTKEEEDAYKLENLPPSVTENNDLSKDSIELTKTANPTSIDVNIDKYISPEFHDKKNIYKLPPSPDIEKYISSDNDAQLKSTLNVDSTSSYDFDKKFQSIQNDIQKKLEYIDDFPRSTHRYEVTTNDQVPEQPDLIKFKNASYAGGNGVYKDEQLETGRKLDYSSSYSHTIFDEQKQISSSESYIDSKPKTNDTEDHKSKIFKGKTTTDPEVTVNQTERRSALLSNKIEHDSQNGNHRVKWPFQNTVTTVPLTTTTGQKEEILFVSYTKENPINISKRGSTKFLDTVTTQKPVERKHTKLLDESAVENQVYPVQVPAPSKVTKEENAATVPSVTETINNKLYTTNEVSALNDTVSTTKNLDENVTLSVVETVTPEINSSTYPSLNSTLNFSTFSPTESFATTESRNVENVTAEAHDESNSTGIVVNTTESSTTTVPNATVTQNDYSNITEVVQLNEITTAIVNHSDIAVTTATTDESPPTYTTLVQDDVTQTSSAEVPRTTDYVSDQTITVIFSNETGIINETTPQSSTITTFETTVLPDSTTSSFQPSTTLVQNASDLLDNITHLTTETLTSAGQNLTTTPTTVVSTTVIETETPIETTTVDYNENLIRHSDIITSTTESIRKDPTNTVIAHTFPVERRLITSSAPNSHEDSTSGYTDDQDGGISGGKIAVIVISCIGALCFVILAVLLFVMRKRHKRFNYGQRCTPVSLDAYSVDNVSTYNSVRRKGNMRASKRSYGNPAFEEATTTHLLNFPELVKFGSNNEGIATEYDSIPQISVQTNELPEGCETKNRYANVIPLPESRVFLSSIDECPNSDYINANFVTGPKVTKNYYIACQAPMQNTVDDFWRMIWEQQSRVVLMLTHLFENGAEKCFDYLPPSEVLDCHRLFGDFQITLKKREVKEKYVISNLQLKNMVSNTWREVTHLWYLGWPERGVPAEESSLVAFLIEARSYAKAAPSENAKVKEPTTDATPTQEHSPIIVHCSPGTGRTGTVIACDIAIREFELTRQVDIPKTVYQIRRNRAGAVQTKEQYAFVYRVITWYANKLTGGVLDSI